MQGKVEAATSRLGSKYGVLRMFCITTTRECKRLVITRGEIERNTIYFTGWRDQNSVSSSAYRSRSGPMMCTPTDGASGLR